MTLPEPAAGPLVIELSDQAIKLMDWLEKEYTTPALAGAVLCSTLAALIFRQDKHDLAREMLRAPLDSLQQTFIKAVLLDRLEEKANTN
jgi:hypothetical protein